MACHEGLLRMPEHIPYAGIIQVGHIYDHAQALHLFHELNPRAGQAIGLVRHQIRGSVLTPFPFVGKSQLIGEIPGQCHHPDPQTVEIPQEPEAALANAALLDGQQGRHPALPPVVLNIPVGPHNANHVTVGLHLRIKCIQKTHTVFKWFSLRPFQAGEQGKILESVIPCLHFLKVYHQAVLQYGGTASLQMVFM